ncbi:MAG: CDP-alcohol phosphatidyltransferase family protein [Candidatus Rokubacteria bacterium]|nr:CDP-alcohol phosphatidyltransferase family protein [Candidatus Rokubacteria bacterium]
MTHPAARGALPLPRAVVYLPDPTSRAAAASQVAGRAMLVRTLLTGERGGVREIGVPASLRDAAVEGRIAANPRLRAAVVWLDRLSPAQARDWSSGPLLLLPANVLLDPQSLRRLLAERDPGEGIALEESKGSLSPILLAPAALAAALWDRLVQGAPLGDDLEVRVRQGRMTLVVGAGFFVPVLDEASRSEAEATLFRSLGISADSHVDRMINRRCSRWLTRFLIRLPVTPNQVTLLSLALGLAAAWMLWPARPASALAGFVLYLLAVVVDHSDGEVARLTFQESAFGEWLDFTTDTVIHAALVLGMGVTASRVGEPTMLVAGAVAAFGVILSALFARFLPEEASGEERLATVLKGLGTRDLFYLVLVAFLLGLWFAPGLLPILVGLLAVGSQGYWLTCLGRRWVTGR